MKNPGDVQGMSGNGNVQEDTIEHVRAEIAKTDASIIRLIAKRQGLAARMAEVKRRGGLAIHDEKQTAHVLESVFNRAVESKVDPVSVQRVFEILIAMSEERQRECSGDGNLP
jgi:chorismate mutase